MIFPLLIMCLSCILNDCYQLLMIFIVCMYLFLLWDWLCCSNFSISNITTAKSSLKKKKGFWVNNVVGRIYIYGVFVASLQTSLRFHLQYYYYLLLLFFFHSDAYGKIVGGDKPFMESGRYRKVPIFTKNLHSLYVTKWKSF